MKNPLSIDSKSYFQADFSAQPTNLAQDTRIAERVEVKSSLRGSGATEAIYESKKIIATIRLIPNLAMTTTAMKIKFLGM